MTTIGKWRDRRFPHTTRRACGRLLRAQGKPAAIVAARAAGVRALALLPAPRVCSPASMDGYARLGQLWATWHRALRRRIRPVDRRTARAARRRAAPVEITVGDAVIAARPERFGANLDVPGYAPWDADALLANDWVADGGMEPLVLRYKGTAGGGSATSIEHAAGPDGPAPPELGAGFFDGAAVRVYRAEGGRARLLRAATVAGTQPGPAGGCRFALAEAGPPVRAGDVFFLSLVRDDAPAIDPRDPRLGPLAGADTWRIFPAQGASPAVAARRDRAAVAPAGGRASLRLRIDAPVEGGVWQYVTGTPGQRTFNALEPGRRYRIELWLRQEGLAGGRVEVSLAPYPERVRRTFAATGEWARYGFGFVATRRAGGEGLARLTISFRGPGALWVDGVRLYDARWPAGALRPEVRRALAAYRPGALRIWSGQTNREWGTSLDAWLAPEGQGLRAWGPGRGPVAGPRCGLPAALALAGACGAEPWLIVHPSFDEAEWLGLAEYLAGPPDSPYGAMRAAAGRARPWAEAFDRIRIEYGNETWNARFRPWTFATGAQYGQLAEHFFGVFRSSPHYPALAGKVDLVLGGWVYSTGPQRYGARARQASASASFIGTISYVSYWNRFHLPAATRDEQFQNALIDAPWIAHYLTDQQVATLSLLGKMGFPSRGATIEGGPDYPLPASGAALDPARESIGKSLAAAVGTLDAFLYRAARGYGPQAYYLLGIGPRWSSHTGWDDGHRPHPAWLALLLRNRYAQGEMVDTAVAGGPRIDLPELQARTNPANVMQVAYRIPARRGIPLIAAYTFRLGRRHAIFVLSRQLSQPTPVTLHLPARPSAATLYALAGDPRATNLDAMRIRIRRRRLRRVAKDHTFTMPPGSIYLFVVDAMAPSGEGDGA